MSGVGWASGDPREGAALGSGMVPHPWSPAGIRPPGGGGEGLARLDGEGAEFSAYPGRGPRGSLPAPVVDPTGPDRESVRLVQTSLSWLADRDTELQASFRTHLFAVLPRARAWFVGGAADRPARLASMLLGAVSAVDGLLVKDRLQVLGRLMQSWGIAEEHFQDVARALARSVQDLSGGAWSTRLSSAWVEVYCWMVRQMTAGAGGIGGGPRTGTPGFGVQLPVGWTPWQRLAVAPWPTGEHAGAGGSGQGGLRHDGLPQDGLRHDGPGGGSPGGRRSEVPRRALRLVAGAGREALDIWSWSWQLLRFRVAQSWRSGRRAGAARRAWIGVAVLGIMALMLVVGA